MLIPDLPKSASLPVATVQETKRRMTESNGSWAHLFDYMFFTESDQVFNLSIAFTLCCYTHSYRFS
jgi:hypothetical protein